MRMWGAIVQQVLYEIFAVQKNTACVRGGAPSHVGLSAIDIQFFDSTPSLEIEADAV